MQYYGSDEVKKKLFNQLPASSVNTATKTSPSNHPVRISHNVHVQKNDDYLKGEAKGKVELSCWLRPVKHRLETTFLAWTSEADG
jgi:hypothetical protein